MTRVLLLRHAAHDLAGRALAGRMPGLGLNALGQRQAQALAGWAQRLAPVGARRFGPVDALWCSPQQRTRETAQPMAQRLALELHLAPAFDEIDVGEWTGQSFEALAAHDALRWRQWCERRSQATPPGGEAFCAVARRVQEGLAQVQAAHPEGRVVVVSHADVIKAAIAGVLGLSQDALERFEVGCASLSVLELESAAGRLVLLNAAPAA